MIELAFSNPPTYFAPGRMLWFRRRRLHNRFLQVCYISMDRSSQYPEFKSETPQDIVNLRSLTPLQRRCGVAAWLGWLFDGLDSYLYVLVAGPFVAALMH